MYGESKVSPKSATSIPRLELCAAVVASQSALRIVNELVNKPDSIAYYTDSKVVLGYVTNTEKRFTLYVSRRVESILNVSSANQWSYVPTDRNPADLATRPMNGGELVSSRWFRGPQFIYDHDEFKDPDSAIVDYDLPETLPIITNLKTTTVQDDRIDFMVTKYSCWITLLRAVTTVVKISKHWIRTSIKDSENKDHKVSSDYNSIALELLISHCQMSSFQYEFDILKAKKCLPLNHPTNKLGLFIDENDILRVGGRLQNVVAPCVVKHPILLPSEHKISTLILDHYHRKSGHQGRHVTHGALREAGFYLTAGNKTIKSFINKCVVCRKLRASCQEQYMADLPSDRVERCAPFSKVGLDVFGHWNIHDGKTTRRTAGTKKVWAVLFTCLYSRAIHVEPLPFLDTLSFQNSLRRFLAVRGSCQLIRSDKGTNLTSTSKDIDFISINKFLEDNACKWEFNPPHASHFGGVWERKIGQMRRAMDAAILKTSPRTLSRDELYTFLQEAANIVNSTPMWEISSDPNDLCPVSPSMLLTQKESISTVENFTENDLLQYGKKRWRRVQFIADHFWKQWRLNYLENLRTRQKWLGKNASIRVGDIVLLREKNCKRNLWPMGIVNLVKRSDDGLVRSAKLKVFDGRKNCFYDRPISEMVLLIRQDE